MRAQFVFFSVRRTVWSEIESTTSNRTNASASSLSVHRSRPSGGSLQARAICACQAAVGPLLGAPRRGSDELLRGPFSRRSRSERPSPGSFCSRAPRHFGSDASRSVDSQEPHAKPRRFFPVEPRAKTSALYDLVLLTRLPLPAHNYRFFLQGAPRTSHSFR